MIDKNEECPICGSKEAKRIPKYDPLSILVICPVCGRYEFDFESGGSIATNIDLNWNKLSSYLFYNGIKPQGDLYDKRYLTNKNKITCDEIIRQIQSGSSDKGYPIHFDEDDINIWFPNKFSEKIDKILLCFHAASKHIGDSIQLKKEELYSCLFVDRYDYDSAGRKVRQESELNSQAEYMMDFLSENGFIKGGFGYDGEGVSFPIKLTPKAYERIDEIQKFDKDSNDVLVAMQFGDETKPLREAIRLGVKNARYNPIFIDEVQHNDLITPELLKYIRRSKFVVVDLSHRNNGAYFEEGYALELGKTVIQLCNEEKIRELHFDIAQKNTIVWKKEEDIPDLLERRISATIE